MPTDPIFMDGFDMYNGTGALTGIQSRWIQNPLGVPLFGLSAAMVTGRYAGQGIQITQTAGNIGNSGWLAIYGAPIVDAGTHYTSLTFCCSLQCAVGTFLTSNFLNLYSTTTGMQMTGYVDSLGQLVIQRGNFGGTTLYTSPPNTILASTWHTIEIEIVFHGSTGTMAVYVDGSQKGSTYVGNTLGAGSVGANYIILGGRQRGNTGQDLLCPYVVDDLHILDGAARNEECWIETLRQQTDVQQQWTPSSGTSNAAMMDDTTVDGLSSYVSSVIVGHRDKATVVPLSNTPNNIYGVQPVVFGAKSDATTRAIRDTILSGVTDSFGSSFNLSSTFQRYQPRILPTDPDTGVQWTPAGVNNLIIGPELTV